jgi:replicative DNA helicase
MLSNEMTAAQITLRMLAILSGVPALKIFHGRNLEPIEYTALEKAYKETATFKLTIVENMNEINKVLATVRKHADKNAIFLDYLGQIQSDDRSEYERLTRISTDLQIAAMQNQVPIIALSQVSNDSAKNASQLLGFKGSGNIAAAADVGIELYRNKDETPNLLNISIRKNRHGSTGSIDAHFDLKTGRIYQQRRME